MSLPKKADGLVKFTRRTRKIGTKITILEHVL